MLLLQLRKGVCFDPDASYRSVDELRLAAEEEAKCMCTVRSPFLAPPSLCRFALHCSERLRQRPHSATAAKSAFDARQQLKRALRQHSCIANCRKLSNVIALLLPSSLPSTCKDEFLRTSPFFGHVAEWCCGGFPCEHPCWHPDLPR